MLKIALIVLLLIVQTKSSCLTEGEKKSGSSVQQENITNALNKFTLKLYKELVSDKKNTKNILTSPYSLWSALTYTYLGSRENNSVELGKVLELSSYSKTEVELNINKLAKKLIINKKDNFLVANKLAFSDLYPLKNCMKNVESFEVEAIDFSQNIEEKRKELNSWVANKTNGKIQDLLSEGSIKLDTITVLMNAAFFKGSWKVEFDKSWTDKANFTSYDGSRSKIDMMKTERNMMANLEDNNNFGAKGVELVYDNKNFSMILALPSKDSTVEDFIKKLDVKNLNDFINSLSQTKVSLKLPKFENSQSLSLKNHLRKLGASKMFSNLDLSGFISSTDSVYISDVLHKSFVKIDEKGTKATAATSVSSRQRKSYVNDNGLVFDKPFVYFIRETKTNAILFMGVVRKP